MALYSRYSIFYDVSLVTSTCMNSKFDRSCWFDEVESLLAERHNPLITKIQ